MKKRLYLSAAMSMLAAGLLAGVAGAQDYPVMNMVADKVIQKIKDTRSKVLLVATFYDRSAADKIAAATGTRVVHLPIDTGGSPTTKTYFELIDHLLSQILGPAGSF